MTNRQAMENEIISRYQSGQSIRALSRLYRIGRNTVRRILRKNKTQRDEGTQSPPKIPRATKLDPYLDDLRRLLEKYPKITSVRLIEELASLGYDGGITQLRARVKKMRPSSKQAVIRYATAPGEMGQMDWSPYRIKFANGTQMVLNCFSYVLKYSGRQYIDFSLKRNFHSLIRRHVEAFTYLDGVPKICLYDGEKTILLRWEAGRPVYNPKFVAFLTHYRCQPLGCRPGRPQTKGAVEVRFKSIENHLLGGRTFLNLDDLRQFTQTWLADVADQRLRQGKTVLERYQEERDALIPLPIKPYDTSEVVMRVGNMDGLVIFDSNRYSVPYEYQGEILTLKAGEEELRIYSPEVKLIATHQRLPNGAGETVEDPEHRRLKGLRYGIEPIRDTFLALGEVAQVYLDGLTAKHPRSGGTHARSILALKNRYHSADIHKALKHALAYSAFDAQAIHRILRARAQPRTLESFRTTGSLQTMLDQAPAIQQRDLDEYDQFIDQGEKDDSA